MSRVDTSSQKINDFLERGVKDIITRETVSKKLASGQVLRVKHGVDPSGDELHLGHASVYLKLRDLQEMGHKIVFLIGGFTGRFGDPTERVKTRTLKSKEETTENAQNYIEQIAKILDVKKLEIRTNNEWYDQMSAEELVRLMSNFTADQVLERDMFQERKKKNEPIQLHELVYPVLQGYDSVMLKSDLTVIGSDQVFNENFGRELQKKNGQAPQDIIAISILRGLDGAQKMGKSLGNYISITASPENQFGQIMSLPDSLIIDYFTLLTRIPLNEIKSLASDLSASKVNPKDLKIKLAQEIVSFFHSRDEAVTVAKNFEQVFSKKETPTNLETIKIGSNKLKLVDLIMASNLTTSKTEARRLIEDGAVDINNKTETNPNKTIDLKSEIILKVGKHRFAKLSK